MLTIAFILFGGHVLEVEFGFIYSNVRSIITIQQQRVGLGRVEAKGLVE